MLKHGKIGTIKKETGQQNIFFKEKVQVVSKRWMCVFVQLCLCRAVGLFHSTGV